MKSLLSLTSASKLNLLSKKGNLKEEDSNHQPHKKPILLKCLASPLLVALLTLSPICQAPASLAQLTDVKKGAALFSRSCIGCHDGGGNILQPGAALSMKDLQKNGMSTEEAIYNITYYGKGRMPGFGENCTPRGQCTFGARLQDEEIKLLAEFVKSQAERGWPNVDSYGD